MELRDDNPAETQPTCYVVPDEPRGHELRIKFNADMSLHDSDGDEEVAGEFVMGFRELHGRDERKISDMMVVGGKKGKQKYQPGAVMREKAVRSNLWIKGMKNSSGRPETRLTYELYDRLNSKIITAIADFINKINEYNEEEEAE